MPLPATIINPVEQMIAPKRLHIIVIALCLWLPLQAIAGQWSHCVKIESALSEKKSTELPEAKNTAMETAHGCHQASKQINAQTTDATSNTSEISCQHCQFVCHWHCVILLADLLPAKIEFIQDYSPFEILSPVQPVLATPQRPPKA
jgi:hypothetical protein